MDNTDQPYVGDWINDSTWINMSLKVRKLSEEPGINETETGFQGVNTVWVVLKRANLSEFSSRIFRMESESHTVTHTHEREHICVVISGVCRIEVGEKSWTVGTGNIITIPPNLVHRFSNPGKERLVLLIMNLTSKIEQIDYIEEGT
jgi:quercetin dioxygenase-like cupin family protein